MMLKACRIFLGLSVGLILSGCETTPSQTVSTSSASSDYQIAILAPRDLKDVEISVYDASTQELLKTCEDKCLYIGTKDQSFDVKVDSPTEKNLFKNIASTPFKTWPHHYSPYPDNPPKSGIITPELSRLGFIPHVPVSAEKSGHCLIDYNIDENGAPQNLEKRSCTDDVFLRSSMRSVTRYRYDVSSPLSEEKLTTRYTSKVTFILQDEYGNVLPE